MNFMKAYSFVLCLVLMFTSVFTGCSAATFLQTVNNVSVKVNAFAPTVEATLTGIAALTNDPQLLVIFNKAFTIWNTDYPVFADTISAYVAVQNKGNKAALLAAIIALDSELNLQLLAANGIHNAQTEQAALKAFAIFTLVVDGFALALGVSAGSTTAEMRVTTHYDEVSSYIPQYAKEQAAESYGYTAVEIGM